MEFWAFDDRRKFVVGLWFRLICATVFLLYLGVAHSFGVLGDFEGAPVTFAALLGLLGANAIYWHVGKATGFDVREFYLHWCFDIILISGVLVGLGHFAESVAISAFTLIIVTSATFISRGASIGVGVMSSIALACWSAGAPGGLYWGASAAWDGGKVLFVWASGSLFFVLIAFLAGTLAKALRDVNALLERRNLELAKRNEELAELQEELEFQANVVAHDIRGPVSAAAAAIAFTGGAGAGGSDNDPLMGMALENLKRVDGMIDRLTEVRELKQAELRRETIDWRSVMAGIRVEFEVELRRRRVTLDVVEPLPMVVADRHYMTVLLRNAIGNALRYVPDDGSGLIRVSSTSNEMAVSDNGPGLPGSDSGDLFRMFRKGKGDLRAGAMGLGLALARRVVERHGGEIWFDTPELGGATLRFRLPIVGDDTIAG
jgi:signal transduction histidine kinase